jgi:hypothetical protein
MWTNDNMNCVSLKSHSHQLYQQQQQKRSPLAHDLHSQSLSDGIHNYRQENPLPDSENTFNSHSANGPLEASDFDGFDALVLPSHLRVPLPQLTAFGDLITIECYEFLDELLDIRFDRRLGATAERYMDLIRHPWLSVNGIHIPSLLSSFVTHTSAHTSTSAHVSVISSYGGGVYRVAKGAHSAPTVTSPIKLNHEALKLCLSRREELSSGVASFLKESSRKSGNGMRSCSQALGSMNSYLVSNRIFPHDHPPAVLDILDSYRYPANY